jgi:hypothetical protein
VYINDARNNKYKSFKFVCKETKSTRNCLKTPNQIILQNYKQHRKLLAYKQQDILGKYSKNSAWALKRPVAERVTWGKLENL